MIRGLTGFNPTIPLINSLNGRDIAKITGHIGDKGEVFKGLGTSIIALKRDK